MKKRTFSKEKKLQVLQEVEESGDVKRTLDKLGIYPATYYSWKRKYAQMGEQGFRHGMTKERLKEIRRLEKENGMLKELMAEKDLKIKMQSEIIKKKPTTVGEKKRIVRDYVSAGLNVIEALELIELSNYHYYNVKSKSSKRRGRPVTTHTEKYIDDQTSQVVENQEVVEQIEAILEDPDRRYGYKRMTAAMMFLGYMIGTKKIYRLMKQNGLLQKRRRPTGRNRVRGRIVKHTRH